MITTGTTLCGSGSRPATIGRLVAALDALLAAEPDLATSLFLTPTASP